MQDYKIIIVLANLVYVTRKEHFNAAHKLYNPKWDKEKNFEVFGKCANENWHGHNFDLWITVKGEPDAETGFVVNFKDLGKLIKQEVIEKLDHKNLNLDVDFMKGKMASCEVLIVEIWKIIEKSLPRITDSAVLHYIKLTETEGNFCEYFG